ncbi:MAG TPA: hypothetical protein VF173_20185 [Thermoanaerobaculia bacterium]|nr:hypothetical protein [Thermoanaerobaculia bacterium]
MADDTPRNADFIGRVVKDAKNPPETRMLTGWLGDAADEGYRRLYTDAELSAYVDIPDEAILHTEPLRDSQPAGAVFVWVRRDATLKYGGTASSRAARFLQGQVAQDFASAGAEDPGALEKAGVRCATQAPCGEVTGFTGRCTKQPVVGGAWPCITAVPHCSEPTGFTGQCTYQPWPNPTQYVGCTIYHCPTKDLTHVKQICNIVATGMPGCPVVDPLGGGGDPAAKASAEAVDEGGGAAAVRPTPPVTIAPGCGYTHHWGYCLTLPPKCEVSVGIPCIPRTEMPQHCPTFLCPNAAFRAAAPGAADPSAVDACPTRLGCETKPPTQFCTQFSEACPTDVPFCPETSCGPKCQTQQPNCTQIACTQVGPQCPSVGAVCPTPDCTMPPACPVTQAGAACPTQAANCTVTPPICFQPQQAFRAVAPIGPSAFLGCTQSGPQCPTFPSGDCTFFGCPTRPQAGIAGPIGCTQSGPQCPTYPSGDCTFFGCPTRNQPQCTFVGAGCPPTPATVCTQLAPCVTQQAPCTQLGTHCPTNPQLDCTFGCTHFGPACPVGTNVPACFVNAQGFARVRPVQPEPTPATVCFICTQIPQLCPVNQ